MLRRLGKWWSERRTRKERERQLESWGFLQDSGFFYYIPTASAGLWLLILTVIASVAFGWLRHVPEDHVTVLAYVASQVAEFKGALDERTASDLKEGGNERWYDVRRWPFSRNAATLVLVVGGLVIGMQRWQTTRIDTSIDRYFDQRRDVNIQLLDNPETWDLVSASVPRLVWAAGEMVGTSENDEQARKVEFHQQMLVYAELDQLEFCFEKYRLRLITPEVAYRACQVILSRCKEAAFADKARLAVGPLSVGDGGAAAGVGRYNVEFQKVVNTLIEVAKGETARDAQAPRV